MCKTKRRCRGVDAVCSLLSACFALSLVPMNMHSAFAQGETIDMETAWALQLRFKAGETLSPAEQKYLDRARALRRSGKASRVLYDSLAGKKRIVSADFAVFPLDDHGDIDASEDVRQSLPPEIAALVLGDSPA